MGPRTASGKAGSGRALSFGLAPLVRASFLERPGRFVVRCVLPDGKRAWAFLPNPGRLQELLLPGASLYLRRDASDAPHRMTAFTAIAVEREGSPVCLHTHLANEVAGRLLRARLIPGLQDAEVTRAEVPVGRSRFDFLLSEGGRPLLLEVKSVTLFGNGVAMFPDAVTERGRRHVIELAALAREGRPTAVLFLVHSARVRYFMPEYHTDLAFARALLEARGHVRILAAALSWRPDLTLDPAVAPLEIPWEIIEREADDRGAYLLLCTLKQRARIQVGRLGPGLFPAGHYVYVGSALSNLGARVARHLRRRKKPHWHIDALRERAERVSALPIRGSARRECDIARALARVLTPAMQGFGSSDCGCPTHLFRSDVDPRCLPVFHDVLQRLRMVPPED